jgi:hypothetical protein
MGQQCNPIHLKAVEVADERSLVTRRPVAKVDSDQGVVCRLGRLVRHQMTTLHGQMLVDSDAARCPDTTALTRAVLRPQYLPSLG